MMLITSAEMLKPGDEIAWTRFWLYDHHALVKAVKGRNEIEVYEFTTTGNGLSSGSPKTMKALSTLQIFNGSDPCYKVIRIPAIDPKILLMKAERSLGREGYYHPISNNCESYVTGRRGRFEGQVKGLFKAIQHALAKLPLASPSTNLDDVMQYFITAYMAVAEDTAPCVVQHLCQSLHAIGFIVPLLIEVFYIFEDIRYNWSDHKLTRIIVGLGGTALTSGTLLLMASVPLTLGLSILMAVAMLLVGFLGTLLTRLVMYGVRRKLDQQTCRQAFAGLFEDGPGIIDRIQALLKKILDIINHQKEEAVEVVDRLFKSNLRGAALAQ